MFDFLKSSPAKDAFAQSTMAVIEAAGFEQPIRNDRQAFALELGEGRRRSGRPYQVGRAG